jgi:putative serine protease PepD
MAEDDRPGGSDQEDYRYFGPFGAPPPERSQPAGAGDDTERTAPLGIGHWSYYDEPTAPRPSPGAAEETQVLPASPGAYFPGQGPRTPGSGGGAGSAGPSGSTAVPWGSPLYPAPGGVPPLRPGPPAEVPTAFGPPQRQRRPMRAASLIALAALIALVVGSAAGYGGSRLAQQAAPAPQTSTQPSVPTPSSSGAPSETPSAPSTPFTPVPGQANTVEVARAALPSTVMIQVGNGTSGDTGSGFVLDSSGRIMTNNHVVAAAADGGRISVVFSDGTKTPATLVGRSPSYDLAVIKVAPSSRLRPIRIGNSDASQIGETVIAIGSPLALPGTVTAGIVSAKDRPVVVNGSGDADAPSAYINAIQTDAPINPGNSGGPLIDPGARVIGVNSAILTLGQTSGQSGSIGLGFAIPINQAMEIGNLLIKNGKATYPVIGANVSSDVAGEGIRLTTVESGGPASKAGLREGDLVTSIDGRTVSTIQELIVTIRTHRPGERVTLGYNRGGARDTADVTLGSKEG